MAYDVVEVSRQDGAPIYLYEFRLYDKYWRYCSADVAVSAGGHLWSQMEVADDGVKQTGEAQVDALTITLPTSNPIVGLFAATPPSGSVLVTIRRMHYGADGLVVCYVGEVSSVNIASPQTASVTCATISASLARTGLRESWSRGCPHALYDSQCRVNKNNVKVKATIATVGTGALTVTGIDAYPDGWFDGGYMEWADAVRGYERRGIESQTGSALVLFGTADGIGSGAQVFLYPGCPRTTAACKAKFNNLDNYGGCPGLPNRSPFDGNPVF